MFTNILTTYFGTDTDSIDLVNNTIQNMINEGTITEEDARNRPNSVVRNAMTKAFPPVNMEISGDTITNIDGETYVSDNGRYVKIDKATNNSDTVITSNDGISSSTVTGLTNRINNISQDLIQVRNNSNVINRNTFVKLTSDITIPEGESRIISGLDDNSNTLFAIGDLIDIQ